MSKKIAIDLRWVRNRAIDGIGRYTLELTKELVKISPQRYLLLFFDKETSDFVMEYLDQPEVEIRFVPFNILSSKDIIFLPRFLRKLKVSFYFSPNYITSPFHPKEREGYKTILVVHDLIPYFFPFSRASFLWRLFYKFKIQSRIILGRAARIIAVSENTATDIVRLFGVAREKIKIVPEAAAKEYHPVAPPLAEERIAKYNLKPGYILYVGRQDPYKNLLGLISAYGLLPGGLRNEHSLVIVGPKNERYFPELLKRIKEVGVEKNVIFPGYIENEDLPSLYSAARIAVLVSFYEGFGLPVLEAMSCGTPVVCSNTSSLPEVAGEAALLVDPKNQEEIAAAFEKILVSKNLSEEFSQKGLERAKKFSWERAAFEINKIFGEI